MGGIIDMITLPTLILVDRSVPRPAYCGIGGTGHNMK
jgi:hypothetical protein